MTAQRLLRRLDQRLSSDAARTLHGAVELANTRGSDLYLVGGTVRDLLLDADHLDIDLVLEGDALELASVLAGRFGARLVRHERFGTATLTGKGLRLDFASARSERYPRPGALPVVKPAAIGDDLARRDFTVNAMALRLTGPRRLLDPHGGLSDLDRGLVRALHDRSFQEDATRILRAVRYAGRLGVRIERQTRSWARRDLAYTDTISGARLRHEMERTAFEDQVRPILSLAEKLGALSAVHSALEAGPPVRAAARLPSIPPARRDAVFFCLLLASASPRLAESAIARLAMTGRQAEAVRHYLDLRRQAGLGRPSVRPSQCAQLLDGSSEAAVEALALLAPDKLAADRARRYLDEWKKVRPELNGRDVEALGVTPGPELGALLSALLTARLDGQVATRDDEIRFVRRRRARARARVPRG